MSAKRQIAWVVIGATFLGYAGNSAGAARGVGGTFVQVSLAVIGGLVIARAGRAVLAHQRAVQDAAQIHELWHLVRYCERCDGVFLPGPGAGRADGIQAGFCGPAGQELMTIQKLHGLLSTMDDLYQIDRPGSRC